MKHRLTRIWTPMALIFLGLLANLAPTRAADGDAAANIKIIKAEAFVHGPQTKDTNAQSRYGVVHLKIESAGKPFRILPDQPWCQLKAAGNRALYPVFPVSDGDNAYWSQADRPHAASTLEALFLFRGGDPLKVVWTLPDGQTVEKTITPQQDPKQHRTTLGEWWQRYRYAAKMRNESDEYPPQIENYLVAMLAERFGFSAPEIQNRWSGRSDVDQAFGLLLGAESIRVAMQRETILKHTRRDQPLNRKLPKSTAPPAITLPTFDKSQVQTEPIAAHVPAECFYVRCGTFQNFRWLRSNLTQWGGMGRDLTALRGWNYHIRDQLEYQLALKETVLSKLFGDTLISDVAVIGMDPFVRAGASVGVVFEARNSPLLKIQLDQLRKDALKADPNARENTVKIAGRDVSFLSTADNKIRAFYAVDGQYHLICTSRTIVERFFEAGQNQDSLADLDEFLYARHLMPTTRDDAAFVYLSDLFFRNLVGPKYRVEMTRRTQAVAEIELVHLAQLAAKAEGADFETIAKLEEGGFLPMNFHIRPDGSHTAIRDGQIVDSLRGARGTFLPVADVDIDEITESELEAYENFSRYYRSQWERMDPAILALKRQTAAQGRQRITVDVHITPYARRHYQSLADSLGNANAWKLIPLKGDLAQGSINFGERAGFVRDQFGFAGVRDLSKEASDFKIENGRVYETVTPPIYYGLLSQQSLSTDSANDRKEKDGQANRPKQKSLSASSIFFYPFEAPDQAEIRENLKMQKVETPAQLRVWINRLADTQIAKIINAHAYLRARRASAGNTRFLHVLTEQFQVEPKAALDIAERVMGADLVCRMGGEYQLMKDDREMPVWRSTAWRKPSYHQIHEVPESFVSALLQGFHEAELNFSIDQTTLSSHLDVELNAPKADE